MKSEYNRIIPQLFRQVQYLLTLVLLELSVFVTDYYSVIAVTIMLCVTVTSIHGAAGAVIQCSTILTI